MDVEQNLCIKYVPVTANDCTCIETKDGDYIYSRFLCFSVNSVMIIVKIIFVGSHFVLNGTLQLEQCCIDIWSAQPRQLDRTTWLAFVQHAHDSVMECYAKASSAHALRVVAALRVALRVNVIRGVYAI